MSLPAVLTIAGSDSSGGAGIQADLKTFTAHKCYGASVISALTAQNTIGVQGVHPAPPEFVEQQIISVLSDVDVHAIKTGMLFDTKIIQAVSKILKEHFKDKTMVPIVCDPVCSSTSGHALLDPDAIDTMINEIFPMSQLITPNIPEAKLLLAKRNLPTNMDTLEEVILAAENLLNLGPPAVLLKGGHISFTYHDLDRVSSGNSHVTVLRDGILSDNMVILEIGGGVSEIVIDVLCDRVGEVVLFPRPRLHSGCTHGTGCTLSAALACELAKGSKLIEATAKATEYTHLAIENAHPIGHGCGPLNHAYSISKLRIPPRTKSNPYPLTKMFIQGTADIWKGYVEHEFVNQLGKGTLKREPFLHFIKQDYHYLKYYARAYALLATKSHSFGHVKNAMDVVFSIVTESAMHREFCDQWGVTLEELESTPESPATTAYGAYLIDVGLQGDSMKLTVALMACLLGYGEVGLWLKKEANKEYPWVKWVGNPYLKWMDDYSGEGYQKAVRIGLETIETRAEDDPPSEHRFEEWRQVWEKCTRLEKGFWDMGLTLT